MDGGCGGAFRPRRQRCQGFKRRRSLLWRQVNDFCRRRLQSVDQRLVEARKPDWNLYFRLLGGARLGKGFACDRHDELSHSSRARLCLRSLHERVVGDRQASSRGPASGCPALKWTGAGRWRLPQPAKLERNVEFYFLRQRRTLHALKLSHGVFCPTPRKGSIRKVTLTDGRLSRCHCTVDG
jgi:hypothetical protein